MSVCAASPDSTGPSLGAGGEKEPQPSSWGPRGTRPWCGSPGEPGFGFGLAPGRGRGWGRLEGGSARTSLLKTSSGSAVKCQRMSLSKCHGGGRAAAQPGNVSPFGAGISCRHLGGCPLLPTRPPARGRASTWAEAPSFQLGARGPGEGHQLQGGRGGVGEGTHTRAQTRRWGEGQAALGGAVHRRPCREGVLFRETTGSPHRTGRIQFLSASVPHMGTTPRPCRQCDPPGSPLSALTFSPEAPLQPWGSCVSAGSKLCARTDSRKGDTLCRPLVSHRIWGPVFWWKGVGTSVLSWRRPCGAGMGPRAAPRPRGASSPAPRRKEGEGPGGSRTQRGGRPGRWGEQTEAPRSACEGPGPGAEALTARGRTCSGAWARGARTGGRCSVGVVWPPLCRARLSPPVFWPLNL